MTNISKFSKAIIDETVIEEAKGLAGQDPKLKKEIDKGAKELEGWIKQYMKNLYQIIYRKTVRPNPLYDVPDAAHYHMRWNNKPFVTFYSGINPKLVVDGETEFDDRFEQRITGGIHGYGVLKDINNLPDKLEKHVKKGIKTYAQFRSAMDMCLDHMPEKHIPKEFRSFKEHCIEEGVLDNVLNIGSKFLYFWKNKWVMNTQHGLERILTRSKLGADGLKDLFKRAIEKFNKMGAETGEAILFYSKGLKQGFVAAVGPQGNLQLITFLPPGKHFAKDGTLKVVMESAEDECNIITEEYQIDHYVEMD